MNKKFITIFKTLLILISLCRVEIYAQGTWQLKSSIPTARKEISHSTISIGNLVYVIGGIDTTGNISNKLEIYNTDTDTWSSSSPVPQKVWRPAAAIFEGKIYLFGRYLTTASFPFTPSDKVYEYNPSSESWTQMADMLSIRGSAAAVTINDLIYLIGGASSTGLSSVHIYNTVNNSWSVGEPMPTARSGLTAIAIDGKIFSAGGYFFSGRVVSLDILKTFDPGTSSWSQMASMPTERHGVGSAVVNNKMYIVGGLLSDVVSHTLEYDPVTDQWWELTDMITPVSFLGVTAVGDNIYAIGGGPVNLNRFDAVNLNRLFEPPPVTSVHNNILIELDGYLLSQNYPNPFNPSTIIHYTLPVPGIAKLRVYNALGNEVAVLINEEKPAGSYNVEFNIDNQELPNGVYFYQLITEDFTDTKKML